MILKTAMRPADPPGRNPTQPGKLRFLQYVNKATRPYWEAKEFEGAVLL